MKKIISILAIVSVLLISCKGNLEQGKLVSNNEFNNLWKLKENNGQRFSIVGHPFIDGDITVQNALGNRSKLPSITFYELPNGQGKIIGMFPIANGKSKNEFYAPETFTMDDVIFTDNDEKHLKHTDKMKISFTMDLQVDRERTGSGDDMKYYGGPADIRIDKAE